MLRLFFNKELERDAVLFWFNDSFLSNIIGSKKLLGYKFILNYLKNEVFILFLSYFSGTGVRIERLEDCIPNNCGLTLMESLVFLAFINFFKLLLNSN